MSPALAQDDVDAREAQLQALVQVLGFADLDDLETFVYLHGSVKVVPAAQSDTVPLDETQTQASEAYREKRRRDRLAENAQLKRDLERTRADLEWHRVELAREHRRNEELERDKARLLDALANATAAGEADDAVGTNAPSGSDCSSRPRIEPCGDSRTYDSDDNSRSISAGPSALVRVAPAAMGVTVSDAALAAEAIVNASQALRTADRAEVARSTPEPTVRHARLGQVVKPELPQRSALFQLQRGIEFEDATNVRIQPEADIRPAGSAGTSETHLRAAADIIHKTPPRLRSIARVGGDGVSASPRSTQLSNARAVALYPKLASEYLKARDLTLDAQRRLAQMDQQLAKASEQIRRFFERAVGAKPTTLDLKTFPDPAVFPPPASNEAKAQLAEDSAFLEEYGTLRQKEAALARHLAQVETWLQRANLAWVELSRLPSASKRPSTPVSGIDLVRKRRKVQGTPTTPAPIIVRPDSTKEAQAAPAGRSNAEPIASASISASSAPVGTVNVTSPATPMPKAEPHSSGSSRRILANTTSQASANLRKHAISDPGEREGGSSASEEATRQDENIAPPSFPKASPRALDVKHEASPSPRAVLAPSPRERVPSRSSTTTRDRSVKLESKPASGSPNSPLREAAWSDLDALTPPAVDEETRKKLKKRNQLKRKRQREASGQKQEGNVTVEPGVHEPNSRKKADRQRMLAEACDSCTSYFQRAGKPVQCGHMESSEGNHYLAMRARGIEERLQENGRHRVQQATDAPPPDYWQFGFPASQDQVDAFNARVRAARKSK